MKKINQIPASMGELKRIVQLKFMNCHLQAPDEDQSMTMSKILDESDVRGDNGEFSKLLEDSVLERSAANEENKRGGRKGKREKNTVDWQ